MHLIVFVFDTYESFQLFDVASERDMLESESKKKTRLRNSKFEALIYFLN